MKFDVEKIRGEFPTLQAKPPPVYLDNACMTLKPACVLEAIQEYYTDYPGCHGRSSHRFGEQLTKRYNETRRRIARFINAPDSHRVIFTRNTTESINLVARGLPFEPGDVVLASDIEHNSNLLPWQRLAKDEGVQHVIVPTRPDTTFDMDAFERAMNDRVRLVTILHVSNLSGVTFPIEPIVASAHRHGALVLVDAAQSMATKAIDLRECDADFLAFSMHKAMGPTGMGVLCGRERLLEQMTPLLTGGETIEDATYDSHVPAPPPDRFEAGLQNYAGVCGTNAALEFLSRLDSPALCEHIRSLNERATERLLKLPGVHLIGPEDPSLRSGILNFTVEGMDPHELAILLDQSAQVMVRSGYQCVHSWYHGRGLPESLRASFAFYNTLREVDWFLDTLSDVLRHFR